MSLKFVLLTLIEREPRTGYDLVRTFDTAVGYFWSASHQQVYRELNSLTEQKLLRFKHVKQFDKPDKKIYSLSNEGRNALHEWIEQPLKRGKTKDLFLVKLLNTDTENVGLMQQELERQLATSQELHAIYLGIEQTFYTEPQLSKLESNDVTIYAALRKGILGIQAQIAWLNELQKLLRLKFGAG